MAFRDESMLITDANGSVSGGGFEGFYYGNTRMLSKLALRIDGRDLFAVQCATISDRSLRAYFHDPAVTDDAHLQDHALTVELSATVGAGLHLDIDLANHSLQPVAFELELLLEADFADSEEARLGQDASKLPGAGPGRGRQQTAPVRRECELEERGVLRFVYEHPQLQEAVELSFSNGPTCSSDGVLWRCAVEPQQAWHTCLDVSVVHAGNALHTSARCYGEVAGDERLPWFETRARLRSTNTDVERSYGRAVSDIEAMALRSGARDEQAAFAAGIPIYQNVFGRDVLFAAWQAVIASPEPLRAALLVCDRLQARGTDDFRDSQPGRIIQQTRTGPLNQLDLNPRGRYYSDYASSPDFLIQLAQHFMWTADRAFFAARLPAARRVLHWIDKQADLDQDGFYEYKTRSPQGDRNQGWKDSERAIPSADGGDAELPLATSEIQGYVYAAKQQMGYALTLGGHPVEGVRLLREARALRKRFNERYWMADEQFIALALDGRKRQVRSIASNAGHCLATGILAESHAAEVVARLMAADMFSGWGVRTLSSNHPAYNPLSYHLGSVWPVEQGTIAFGMKRYGFDAEANAVAQGTFDLTGLYQLHRLPEAVGGYPRDARHPFPAIYPQSCWPQAWSATSVVMQMQAILGMWAIAPLGMLFIHPTLPEWLPDISLHGMRVGGSVMSLRFHRESDGTTGYKVLERSGGVRVIHEQPDRVPRGVVARLARPTVGLLRHGW
jgi:glycogen debranching enzyme